MLNLLPNYLDNRQYINPNHNLSTGLICWLLCVPNLMGGRNFYDIATLNSVQLTSMSAFGNGWRPPRRTGGFGTLLFGGSPAYAVGTNNAFGDLPGNMSLSLWINPLAAATRSRIIGRAQGTLLQQYYVEIGSTVNKITTGWGNVDQLISNGSLNSGTWYHIIFTRSGVPGNWSTSLYINGILDKMVTGIATAPSQPNLSLTLSRRSADTSGLEYNGYIDDIRLYTRAISSIEANQIYTNSLIGYPDILNRLDIFGKLFTLSSNLYFSNPFKQFMLTSESEEY